MKDFAGKVAVITGAGSGFGLELARLGAGQGMRLVLADVQEDALAAAVTEMRSRGADALGVRADVSKAEDVDRAAAAAKSEFGAVHLLFNNAGVAGGGGYLWESRLNDWKWILGVNLMGVVHGIRSFVPLMLEHGGEGHVVNTASAAGLVSSPLMGAYNASKHAVVTLSETLHHELRLANASIGVSVLCPAYVPTGISRSERNRPAELADDAPPTSS
ncbi:MAG: SDR family NAD(P)-dependent oxidoreductase [Myxococcales bacterium]